MIISLRVERLIFLWLSSIYTLEKSVHNVNTADAEDAEASPLIQGGNPDVVFQRALDSELEKICSFYRLKELEVYGEVGALIKDEETYKEEAEGHDLAHLDGLSESRTLSKSGRTRHGSLFKNFGFGTGAGRRRTSMMSGSIDEGEEDVDSDDDFDESTALHQDRLAKVRSKTWDSSGGQSIDDLRSSRELPKSKRRTSQAYDDYNDQNLSALYASGLTLKKRTISLYVSLCELKSFIQLNKTGFSKALKKYDKTLDRNLRNEYTKASVNPAHPFTQTTMQHLDENIGNMEKIYADVISQGDLEASKRELRLHLREHVIWERNTVWREMIGIERKAQAANMGIRRTLLGGDHDPSKARLQGDEPDNEAMKEVITPVGRITCPRWLVSSTFFLLVAIVAIFVALLFVPIMEHKEQQNCLAMLVFVSLLWATEVSSSMMLSARRLTTCRSFPCL